MCNELEGAMEEESDLAGDGGHAGWGDEEVHEGQGRVFASLQIKFNGNFAFWFLWRGYFGF